LDCQTATPFPAEWPNGEQVIGDLLRDRHAGATHHALAERCGGAEG
jgi:hypothetical protein